MQTLQNNSVPTEKYIPFFPAYTPIQKIRRYFAIGKTFVGAIRILAKSRKTGQLLSFGASLEITDRCNAGCNYCYVYPKEWDQNNRIRGYLELNTTQHRQKEKEIYSVIDKLSREGKVLITLVGGEPTLAPSVIQYAAKKFPVVWVVSNGSSKFPETLPSVVYSVSIDGPPEYHNKIRDPLGFFKNYQYGNISGMSAAIVRNINASSRGAFTHITLTKDSMDLFPETVHWLCRDVTKMRGIMVSGAATKSLDDPLTLTPKDRLKINNMIEEMALFYGWQLFPFNQPGTNKYLFDSTQIIRDPSQCSVARRVDSLNFNGERIGKCVLRDETSCETCVCNLTGLMRAVSTIDMDSIKGLVGACFG